MERTPTKTGSGSQTSPLYLNIRSEGDEADLLYLDNILLSANLRPVLSGIGIYKMHDLIYAAHHRPDQHPMMAFTAPEYLALSEDGKYDPAQNVRKPPGDVYSYAMTCLQVYTTEPPFGTMTRVEAMIRASCFHERPGRPVNSEQLGLSDGMWALIQDCWKRNPEERPTMDDVLQRLEAMEAAGSEG